LVRPNDTICSADATIDFSAGFPDDWNLKFTDIKVPSEHVQDGKQYDAEVILSHVYSKNKTDKFVSARRSFVCTMKHPLTSAPIIWFHRSATLSFSLRLGIILIIMTFLTCTFVGGSRRREASATTVQVVSCMNSTLVYAQRRPILLKLKERQLAL
jgi:hypothetical protein